jgi:pimeloyl-ACP methyl ester carboxylesterase
MGRGWKIACGVVLALFAATVVNLLVVDADTDGAAVTVPDGEILELPGGDVQVVDRGPRGADPIVLIHCFSCAMDYWDAMLAPLEADHRVVAVDLRGHGGSEKPNSGYAVPEQAELVAEALRELQVSDAEVVGHSLGGSVAVALAEGAPALVDRVAIIDMPPDHTYGDLGFIAGLAFQPLLGEALWTIKPDFSVRQGLEVAFAPGFDFPDAFVDDVNRLTYTAYDESPAQVEKFIEEESLDQRLRKTAKPLMVLMGAEEQIVDDPERALAQYAGTVSGAETHLIAGAGHSPNVEKPAQTARLVLAFANSP